MTWVGSGETEGESFHAQWWRGTVAEQGSAWSASIYIYIYIYIKPHYMERTNNNNLASLREISLYSWLGHYVVFVILKVDGDSFGEQSTGI